MAEVFYRNSVNVFDIDQYKFILEEMFHDRSVDFGLKLFFSDLAYIHMAANRYSATEVMLNPDPVSEWFKEWPIDRILNRGKAWRNGDNDLVLTRSVKAMCTYTVAYLLNNEEMRAGFFSDAISHLIRFSMTNRPHISEKRCLNIIRSIYQRRDDFNSEIILSDINTLFQHVDVTFMS